MPCARTTSIWTWTAEDVVRGKGFWTDQFDDLISYTFKSRPLADKIVAIAHNAKAFDLLVLNRLVRMKSLPELIMNGQEIMCLKVECHVAGQSYIYSHATQKVARGNRSHGPEIVVPHLFNTTANLNYVGPAPDVSYYGTDHMHESEMKEFLSWYKKS